MNISRSLLLGALGLVAALAASTAFAIEPPVAFRRSMRSNRAVFTAALWVLAALWVTVALIALRGRRERGELVCGVVALGIASAHTTRWSMSLLVATRRFLKEVGVYQHHNNVKIGIVAVVALILVAVARWVWLRPPGLRGALIATIGFAGYLAAYTVWIYDHVPTVLMHMPGRQLLELAFVVPAIACIRSWKRASPRAD